MTMHSSGAERSSYSEPPPFRDCFFELLYFFAFSLDSRNDFSLFGACQ